LKLITKNEETGGGLAWGINASLFAVIVINASLAGFIRHYKRRKTGDF
jgi:hypothetical protein